MATSDPLVQVSAAPRERPILFSGEMVRAILAGRKTQTRRVLRSQPSDATAARGTPAATTRDADPRRCETAPGSWHWVRSDGDCEWHVPCAYGAPGDLLWVRETWYCDDYRAHGPALHDPEMRADFLSEMHYRADHDCRAWEAGCPCRDENGRGAWRPSIHMPRWASRISLRITSVRVERLHEITDADAIAEGCPGIRGGHHPAGDDGMEPREEFEALWSRINGTASWNANPWVWVVGFELGEVRDGQ